MKQPDEYRFSLDAAGLDAKAVERFEEYLALLLKWNARMNLTSVRNPHEIVRRHFAESIFAAAQIPKPTRTLLDFGSGAGFPGIPIAICRPKIGVTLAESQGRKAAFLQEAVRTLGLKVEVWPGRVQAMESGRVFDAVTLRAVDKMPEACRAAVERAPRGGWIAVFTTRKTEVALEKVQGVRWEIGIEIPGSEQELLKSGYRT
ncbi:MAG TPA: 16S rRNA (guanine(527)-N(7))-methyltransferase RsmG [Acidobacteriaceae bacterium]|jgi:16S rRNA (guanine527-N7)-methyltransferase|nr:16S rRNA (guanine(527)-N(7))-methyltransferase RsmG [Acidobacteriaceae bacterium]